MTDWKIVATFSTSVETLKRLDRTKLLSCLYHPTMPGDALVTMQFDSMEEVLKVNFKTYADDLESIEEFCGGLKLYKVTDVESFKGRIELDEILEDFFFS